MTRKLIVIVFDDIGEVVSSTIHDSPAEAERVARNQPYGCKAMIQTARWICKICGLKTYEDLRRSRGVCFDCIQELYYSKDHYEEPEADDD